MNAVVPQDDIKNTSFPTNEAENSGFKRYRDNALDGFRNGASLDLRARVALAMLEHSPAMQGASVSMTPAQAATWALDAAAELLALAEKRNLVEDFKSLEHDRHLKNHIGRQVDFQSEMGKQQQRAAREASGVVQPLAGGRH